MEWQAHAGKIQTIFWVPVVAIGAADCTGDRRHLYLGDQVSQDGGVDVDGHTREDSVTGSREWPWE